MSPNVRMIWGCLWGPCGTLERALGWIRSSHLCYSALQAVVLLLTELRAHLGAVSPQGQEAWDPWAAVSPHRTTAATDKEPTCTAWALWHSASCLGNFESHLEPLEALLGWPSEGWTPGSRSHGRSFPTEVIWHCCSVHGASLQRAVTGCESYLA